MNPKFAKSLPLILVALIAIILLAVRKCNEKNEPIQQEKVKTNDKHDASSSVNRDRGFDRRVSYLQYSNHARCRMDCRHITQAEVKEIMQDGKINYNKSDLQNGRCPRYAVEGITKDNQDVRIIFAQCNENTTVVTVIDLEKNWTCDCPGDDN
jgi:hypothetical protein